MRESAGKGHRDRWAARVLVVAALVALNGVTAAADSGKTLRVAFSIAESSFDPQFSSDAPSDSIVDNMHQAYERLQFDRPEFGAFIAGPSKTADIEQSLVIGAHGPRSLTVFCVAKL